jgi:hypothetical protein
MRALARQAGTARPQSLTMAITIPATTNTTIATCIHIHVGDMG